MIKLPLSKKMWLAAAALLAFSFLGAVQLPKAWATGVYYSQIPDSYPVQGCNLCHDETMGFQDFALDFVDNNYIFTGLVPPPPPVEDKAVPEQGHRQPTALSVILPADVVRGEQIQLQAQLTAGGRAVEGREIQFFEKTTLFVGPQWMSLGTATTDQLGVASLDYQPRATTEQVEILATMAGDQDLAPAEARNTMSLIASAALVQPFQKLQVPYLGNWTIFLLVAAVLVTFGYALVNGLQIAKLAAAGAPVKDQQEKSA